MKSTNPILQLLLIPLLMFAFPSSANEMPDFPFLTATGYASVEASPDRAFVSFSILNFDKDADRAMKALNKTSFMLTKHFLDLGLTKKQITTHNITKQSKRATDRKTYQQLDILGYEVRQRFQLELTDVGLFDSIMNKLLVTELVENIGSSFDVSNRDELESELIINAGAQAKRKAKMLARGVGVKVKSVFAVNDSNERGFQPQYRLREESMGAFAMKSAGNANLYIPETIKLEKSLTVIYKIAN